MMGKVASQSPFNGLRNPVLHDVFTVSQRVNGLVFAVIATKDILMRSLEARLDGGGYSGEVAP